MAVNYLVMGYKLTTKRLDKVIADNGIDRPALFGKLNISKQRWQHWKNRGIPDGMVPVISKETGLSIEYLLGQGKPLNPQNRALHEAIDSLSPEFRDRVWFAIKAAKAEEEAATNKNR